tara:strand:- start:895 stop:1356 length:462 start_codon:yes stop_codon:yes gene_type:complete
LTKKLVISACLCGRPCRYDGKSSESSSVEKFVEGWRLDGGEVFPVCPEELGELGTPRPPAELRNGVGADIWREGSTATVRRKADNSDVTKAFTTGAILAMSMANDATHALLKSRSPSCGVGQVWSDGTVVEGDGVFASLLRTRGVSVFSEEEI